jgi:hypothetical protein
MDYITRHYKNLSEQLAAKVNHLQQLLNEVSSANAISSDSAGGPGFGIQVPEIQQPATGPRFNKGPSILPPWQQAPPQPGTIVTWNGKNYRYEGNGFWSIESPAGSGQYKLYYW